MFGKKLARYGFVRTMAFKAILLSGIVMLSSGIVPSSTWGPLCVCVPTPAQCSGESDVFTTRLEYGITLALTGEEARAESVFVSLLSHSPKDARPLTNLGNLHLMRGQTKTAIAFYDEALKVDSTDAGIFLNRSIANMLGGDDRACQLDARKAITLSGGVENAGSLVGMRRETAQTKEAKPSEKPRLSKDEIKALLNAASSAVPIDSTDTAGKDSTGTATEGAEGTAKKATTWRSAGLRAAEQTDIATTLYWKQ